MLMTHNVETISQEAGKTKDRPFPWRCPKCLKKTVELATISYKTKAAHDDSVYELTVPNLQVPQCRSCGELLFGNRADEQIRRGRESLGLSQSILSQRLGVSPETIASWETDDLIQSRAMDNLLRV